MQIKNLPLLERPREKLLEYGASKLSDEELLAIIIKNGTKGYSAKDLGILILEKIGGLENLKNVNIHTLDDIKGLGLVKKIEILVLVELGKRIYLNNTLKYPKKYLNPEYIYNDNKCIFNGLKQEYFYCLYLDSKKNLIERKLLFMGTVDRSLVHPREVFKNAYLYSASCFICMHNHPSGDITPSRADIEITNTLREIGKIQGIEMLDHLIISDNAFFSFYQNKLME